MQFNNRLFLHVEAPRQEKIEVAAKKRKFDIIVVTSLLDN